jgi:exopolyphosphatase/guanosine-5'-triphosphate,3'-diphosphate pyrophosphatase
MRLSVVDAGSNTVRLVVTDATDGVPLPVHTAKWKLRLSEQVGPDGHFGERATEELVKALRRAAEIAARWGARSRWRSPPPSYATHPTAQPYCEP